MKRKQSELQVITKSKDLCSYIMVITQKSPKHFRFTFVSRLQNLSLSVIENLYRANDTFVAKGEKDSIHKPVTRQVSGLPFIIWMIVFYYHMIKSICRHV